MAVGGGAAMKAAKYFDKTAKFFRPGTGVSDVTGEGKLDTFKKQLACDQADSNSEIIGSGIGDGSYITESALRDHIAAFNTENPNLMQFYNADSLIEAANSRAY